MINIVIYILWYLLIGAIYGAWSWDFIWDFSLETAEQCKGILEEHGISKKFAVSYLCFFFSAIVILIWPFLLVTVLFKTAKKIFGDRK